MGESAPKEGKQSTVDHSIPMHFTPEKTTHASKQNPPSRTPLPVPEPASGCLGYHIWQNLNTGEQTWRPARPSVEADPVAGHFISDSGHPLPLTERAVAIVKKERISWTGELQAAFQDAIRQLGNEATPKPIMKVHSAQLLPACLVSLSLQALHDRGFTNVTRDHVSSHLQKHKLKQSHSASSKPKKTAKQ